MSATSEYYFSRADECNAEAEAALLDMVRERCLRSAAAWRAMGERSARAELMRVEIAHNKSVAAAY